MDVKIFQGKNPDVWKYVFYDEKTIAESVLYRYKDFSSRTVICCSVMSGCPVGCTFCGTGKMFLRNLTSEEIVEQIIFVLRDKKIDPAKVKKFQIMFMSMGEPMLNWDNVEKAIKTLNELYPDAQLLLSSIGIDNKIILNKILNISKSIPTTGLQFSVHHYSDIQRDKMIPYKSKLTLQQISDFGVKWHKTTGRKPFINYIVMNNNSGEEAALNLANIFDPKIFRITLSVYCETDKAKNPKTSQKLKLIKEFQNLLLPYGFDIRVFNPAGQDDIGGGCGQLWFVQDKLKQYKKLL